MHFRETEHRHCCRWGGEEFLLIMQCEHDPVEVAEKIRSKIEERTVSFNGKEIRVTISTGVAISNNSARSTVHDLIELADQAMYDSKNHGKNKVTVKR